MTFSVFVLFAVAASAEQLVFLDFDTFTDGVSDDGKDYVYSPGERLAIVDMLNGKFASYPVTFTSTPPSETFSRVSFNVGLSGAENIDFRNTIHDDDAKIHVPKLLEVAGLTAPFASADVILASANIAAHETLHLLGTRHHDSYLPIGGGPPTPAIGSEYTPPYIGPAMAFLTEKEFNSLTTSIGFSAEKLLDPDLIVGPRSAVKILHEEFGDATVSSADANVGTSPQPLTLKTIPIPNPFMDDPVLGHLRLFADAAIVVDGAIDPKPGAPEVAESDYYSISAEAGDFVHVEVWSDILDFRLSPFDAAVIIRDPVTFTPLPWPSTFGATSYDERESSDAFLWDVFIPASGSYLIEVTHDFGPGTSDGRKLGDYEMLVYRIWAVPEASTFLLAAFAGCTLLVLPSRRRSLKISP